MGKCHTCTCAFAFSINNPSGAGDKYPSLGMGEVLCAWMCLLWHTGKIVAPVCVCHSVCALSCLLGLSKGTSAVPGAGGGGDFQQPPLQEGWLLIKGLEVVINNYKLDFCSSITESQSR